MDEHTDRARTDTTARAAGRPEQTLVVIGNGMMSWKLCQKLVECGANTLLEIIVIGEERHPAYDRVHLTGLLSGTDLESLILAPVDWYEDNGIQLHLDDPVVAIDVEECCVRTGSGLLVPYDRLVFATGSRPFVPPIEGADLPGVFVYRTIEHIADIIEYSEGMSRAAVIGGGILGLEAAKAVHDLGLEVHVIHNAPGLMNRQLDAAASALLKEKIEEQGVRVLCSKQTTRIEDGPHEGALPGRPPRLLHFADRSPPLDVDMVLISAGITPRGELAAAAGIEVAPNGGIVVDDHLTTSDPRIFAVGECAVHRGTTYGLAFPGYKMVEILVDNLVGGRATFTGADQSARLKLMGVSVAALGEFVEKDAKSAVIFNNHGVYRKLVMPEGRITGCVTVGEWDNLERVRDAIEQPRLVSVWDVRRFKSTGSLWQTSESLPIVEWPADALVCGCVRVNRGTLSMAYISGCITVEELGSSTGAGTICGSCKPLLAELLAGRRDSSAPSMRGDRMRLPSDRPPPSLRNVPMSVRSGPSTRRSGSRGTAQAYKSVPPPAYEPVQHARVEPESFTSPPTPRRTSRPPAHPFTAPLTRRTSRPPAQPVTSRETPEPPAQRPVYVSTPTPVVPSPQRAAELADDSDEGPLSRRGATLPSTDRRGRARSVIPTVQSAPPRPPPTPAPPAPIPIPLPRWAQETAAIERAVGPASTRLTFKPPERISYVESDSVDDEPAPMAIRSSASARAPITSRMTAAVLRAATLEADAAAVDDASDRDSILPPAPRLWSDSMLPPPDASPPPSLRDFAPASARAFTSLQHRGSVLNLTEESAAVSREAGDHEGDGRAAGRTSHAFRGREGRPVRDATASHLELVSSPNHPDSRPPPSRRESLRPLVPLSVPPPARVSAAPGAFSGRVSMPARVPVTDERGGRVLLAASIGALMVVVVVAAVRPLPTAASALGSHLDVLWTTSVGKQATGYAALGFALASLLLSLRKRWARFTYSDVPIFRALHAILGLLALVAMVLHTGLHLGKNLNRTLMIELLGLAVLGSAAGVVTALSHWFSPMRARDQRLVWSRAHLMAFWPLPALLALHILGAYYY